MSDVAGLIARLNARAFALGPQMDKTAPLLGEAAALVVKIKQRKR